MAGGVFITTNDDASYNDDAVAVRRKRSFIFELILSSYWLP